MIDLFEAVARQSADAVKDAEASVSTPDDLAAGDEASVNDEAAWLLLARQAYRDSTDWFESGLRGQLEQNIALFQSRHPPGSKYLSDAYKNRARHFRPKTRTAVRRHEAACERALFSSTDLVTVAPGNDVDPKQAASAAIHHALLNYRLERSLPWFRIAIGAYQQAMVHGVVVSKQYWDYAERIEEEEVQGLDPETGVPASSIAQRVRVLRDKPCITVIPPENIRIDPGADWLDPVESTPYIIHMVPMYAGEVLERMEQIDPATGLPEWRPMTLGEVIGAGRVDADEESVRHQREARRPDPTDVSQGNEFTVVWVREYIMRRGGDDYVFHTLGDSVLLYPPKPIGQVYLHGRRPFVLGHCALETHRIFPQGPVEMGKNIQAQANDLANQRDDNVRLVMNKRYFLRRGANIDQTALMRNVPGGAVTMDNPQADVQVINTPDVTSSAYAEQDRLNADYDDLVGGQGMGSVMTNRSLNETVGGMNQIAGAQDAIGEYQLRTFVETWVEPVLRQLVALEAAYESDERVLALVGERAKLREKWGVDQITDELLMQDVILKVNLGIGAANPEQRMGRLNNALSTALQLPGAADRLKPAEVIAEVLGLAGFRNTERFFMTDEEFQQAQQGQQPPQDPRVQVAQMRAELEMKLAQLDAQLKALELQQERELTLAKLAADQQTTVTKLQAEVGMGQRDIQTRRDIAAVGVMRQREEAAIKRQMGSGL